MWQESITEAIALFVIIDPIGGSAIFLSLTANRPPAERQRIALQSVLVAAGILIGFLIAGRILLDAMGIPINSFQIAGGVILLVFGMNMIFEFSGNLKPSTEPDHSNVAVYPLAMPALAGPGTIMTIVLMSDDDRHNIAGQGRTVLVLLGVLLLTYGMFRLSMALQRFLGDTGASIVKRIMGLLLCAIAVNTILSGIAHFCKELPG